MRSVYRSVLGTLAAILAIAALTASSASAALPEFKLNIHNNTFTGSGGQVTIVEGGSTYICNSSSIAGEVTGAKEVAKVFIKFNHGNGGASDCMTFCQTSTGLWETRELKGRIAYISKPEKRVGLLLEAVTEPITTCKHFTISGAKVQGSAIAGITPVNTLRKTPFSLGYETSGSRQVPRSFEGEELIHQLNILPFGAGSPTEFALGTTMTLTFAHEIEIAA